ncbi:unnamed protein product [Musa hybrid cultivar]
MFLWGLIPCEPTHENKQHFHHLMALIYAFAIELVPPKIALSFGHQLPHTVSVHEITRKQT